MQIPANSIRFLRTVSIGGGVPCPPINVIQYDKAIPVAAVTLTENGVKYTPPEGSLLKVRMKKPDGHSVYNNALGLWNNGEVLFLFTQQMTAAFGEAFLNVEITLPDTGAVKCSDAILVFISENAVQQKDIESSDEFLTLVEILELCKKLAAAAQKSADNAAESEASAESSATLSESWAVGGTGTREGEDTDNSKYYSEQSSKSAQQAETSASSASASASASASSETNAKASETASAQSAASAAEDAQRAEDAADRAEAIVDGDAFMKKAVYDANGDGKVDTAENAEQLGGIPANSFLQKTGDGSNLTAAFTQASARANLTAGEKLAVSFGKLMKWFSDLKTVAFSGSYNDLSNKPTTLKNPTALTLQMNGGSSQTYDGSAEKTFNVTPAGINAFSKTDVIPLSNGGTGVTRVLDLYTQLKMVPITVVKTTDSNGQVVLATEWWPGQNILYVVATLSGSTGTSVRMENPQANKFTFTCFNGSNRLANTAVRLNFIFGTGWNIWE